MYNLCTYTQVLQTIARRHPVCVHSPFNQHSYGCLFEKSVVNSWTRLVSAAFISHHDIGSKTRRLYRSDTWDPFFLSLNRQRPMVSYLLSKMRPTFRPRQGNNIPIFQCSEQMICRVWCSSRRDSLLGGEIRPKKWCASTTHVSVCITLLQYMYVNIYMCTQRRVGRVKPNVMHLGRLIADNSQL